MASLPTNVPVLWRCPRVIWTNPVPSEWFISAAFPKKKTKTADDIANDDEALRIADSLRSWRRKVADEMNVPPYVIFGDKTLYDIASRKPTALPQLMDCYGIGEAKAQRFWKDILRIVKGE